MEGRRKVLAERECTASMDAQTAETASTAQRANPSRFGLIFLEQLAALRSSGCWHQPSLPVNHGGFFNLALRATKKRGNGGMLTSANAMLARDAVSKRAAIHTVYTLMARAVASVFCAHSPVLPSEPRVSVMPVPTSVS